MGFMCMLLIKQNKNQIIMALAGFIISILAFLFSLFIYFVHDKKIKDQTELINAYQLKKIDKENIENKKAKLEASVVKNNNSHRTIIVLNKGRSIARNASIIVPDNNKFYICRNPSPIDIIPQMSVQIVIELFLGYPNIIELQFEWDDAFQEKNITTQMVQL
jgi:hypothetical protein